MYHYTYKIHYSTGKFYIGVRTSKCLPEEDTKYIGSSKYTPNDLIIKKEILKVFETREKAIEHEVYLHNIYDIAINPLFYNQAKQTSKKFDVTGKKQSKEHSDKIRKAKLGHRHSKEIMNKIAATREETYRRLREKQGYIRKMPEEVKQKIRVANKGKQNPRLGKTLDSQTRNREYASRRKFADSYEWVNTITSESASGTIYEMAYKYASDKKKPVAGFRLVITGKNKSYLNWKLKRT